MENVVTPQQKAELLQRIRSSRAALDLLVGRLSERQLAAPGPDGGWAVKDHLTHLAAWEQKTLAMIDGLPGYQGLQVDQATYETSDIDELNAILQQRFKDLSAADVLAEAGRSYQRVLAVAEALSPADLSAPYAAGDPDNQRRMIEGIVANTYEHYDEHRDAIAQIIGHVA